MSTAWPGGAELPTEPVGSLPRPSVLQRAVLDAEIGQISAAELERAQDAAVRDTLDRFAETGSPLVSDGEQRRQSFSSYPLGTSPHDGGVEVGPVFAVSETRKAGSRLLSKSACTCGEHRILVEVPKLPKPTTVCTARLIQVMSLALAPRASMTLEPLL